MPELNDDDYFPLVTEVEDDEYEEAPVDDEHPEYLLDDGDVSDTEDVILSQDKNQLDSKILDVWERDKALLDHDYSRSGYMIYVGTNTHEHAKVSVWYIYVNYNVIFL